MKRVKTKETIINDGISININVSNDMPLPKDFGAALFTNEEAYDCVKKALQIAYVNKLIEWKTEDSNVIKELIYQFELDKKTFENTKSEEGKLAKV